MKKAVDFSGGVRGKHVGMKLIVVGATKENPPSELEALRSRIKKLERVARAAQRYDAGQCAWGVVQRALDAL